MSLGSFSASLAVSAALGLSSILEKIKNYLNCLTRHLLLKYNTGQAGFLARNMLKKRLKLLLLQ